MEYESLVYGCIIVTGANDTECIATNRDAMMSLPTEDEWSFLAQEMFSIPDESRASFSQVVHFGAAYRGIEYEWQRWIEQFEALLRRMYWVSAKVHLETVVSGTHTFTWESENEYHKPGTEDIRVQCEWSREGNV